MSTLISFFVCTDMLNFTIINSDPDSEARTGIINTDNGDIETPIFMPVGTLGTVKCVPQDRLNDVIQAQIILGNTYHLYLRPGMNVITKAGGLHKFINWGKPMLTDSGGYQVFSLSAQRKIKEEGVTFRSHIDGSKHLFTSENVIDTQRKIGADIIMAFDECTPYPCDYDYAKKSMDRTHRWLDRCITRVKETEPLYGHRQTFSPIVQGSMYRDLRKLSAEYIASKEMPMNAIGGLSVGEPHDVMYEMIEVVNEILPKDKPRYLMGVGTPANLLESIERGIDMFDCVLPTRNARHGLIYTYEGRINIKNAEWKDDFSLLDEELGAPMSKTYTKAYIRHLFQVNEFLGMQIASEHNLYFFMDLVKKARNHLKAGTFSSWKASVIQKVQQRL